VGYYVVQLDSIRIVCIFIQNNKLKYLTSLFRFLVQLCGIIVGHLYFFLVFKYPQDFGGPRLLQTPNFLYVNCCLLFKKTHWSFLDIVFSQMNKLVSVVLVQHQFLDNVRALPMRMLIVVDKHLAAMVTFLAINRQSFISITSLFSLGELKCFLFLSVVKIKLNRWNQDKHATTSDSVYLTTYEKNVRLKRNFQIICFLLTAAVMTIHFILNDKSKFQHKTNKYRSLLSLLEVTQQENTNIFFLCLSNVEYSLDLSIVILKLSELIYP